MSLTPNDEAILEAMHEDFDMFLQMHDWKNAQAVIDNLYDNSFESSAVYLRRKLLNAQKDFAEKEEITFEPYEHEIPVMTAAEKFAWTEPTYNSYDHSRGRDSELLNELHQGTLDRDANA